ncbi:MAG: DUF262 domain-containing protein [Roseburia sp.]|nr:DUF262 domain-containing protein [Roseburia sp.]
MPAYDSQAPKRTGLMELILQSQGSQFVIPVYQRNYTWTSGKEVKQYFDDLKSVLCGQYDKHFMGIMIYLDTPIDFSSREFSVIDGQQRLTTTFLLLYAIKEIMLKRGMAKEADALNNQYLTNPYSAEKLKYKLKPLVADDEVYQKIVEGDLEHISTTNSNVYKNYIWLKDNIEKLLGQFSINDILMAMNKLYIVCVPISQDDYPQKIFESINATGAKLTASDLIRNFMLMPILSDKQEEFYAKYWKRLEDLLTNDSKKLEAFFRLYLATKNKSLPNKNAVYSVFVEWFNKNKDSYGIEGIFKDILKYAEYYYTIYKQDIKTVDSKIRNSVREFRYILSEMPAPLFMELYALMQQRLITIEQFDEVMRLTNTYLIRRALCGLDTSDITRLFPSLLNDVLNDCAQDYSKLVESFKRNLVNKNKGNSMEMPDDTKLYSSIIDANMYNLRITVRMFFDKLELAENPAPVDLSTLSIEHLMPQTPTTEWYSELGVSDEVYQRNLHRLGNLTLASKPDNSKMQNKVWTYKNEILASTSHLKMNESLLKKDRWTIDDIDARTKDLIEQIKRLYPYFEVSGDSVKKYPIYLEASGILATGKFYEDDGSVEVDEGSILNTQFDNATNYPDIEDMRQELLSEGIIGETESGLCFLKNYIFYPHSANSTALSQTAALLLHGSRNGWDYWLLESGKPINSNKTLKKKFS